MTVSPQQQISPEGRLVVLETIDGGMVGHAYLPIEVIPPRFLVWNHRVFEQRTALASPGGGIYREVFAWWTDR